VLEPSFDLQIFPQQILYHAFHVSTETIPVSEDTNAHMQTFTTLQMKNQHFPSHCAQW